MFEPASEAVVAGRYRLVCEIGRGGMGAVWEAFDLELDVPCALKFILDEESKPPDVRARFLREARAVARLQSPHVVTIRGVGEWEGALFIAMELLVGETLFDRLARQGKLSLVETARIVEQLAAALLIAHRSNIVHRDLKPENIWLWGDGEPFVKLLDFGIAKLVTEPNSLLRTATGKVIGTPHYMSPEQAAGDRQVDHRSDMWSLAVIAVECLSGKRVFHAGGMGQLLANIINGPTPSLLVHYPEASPALLSWWERSTSKRPEERYSSAPELSREFTVGLGLASRPNEFPSNALVPPNARATPKTWQAGSGPEATLTGPGETADGPIASPRTQSVLPLSSTRNDASVVPHRNASPSFVRRRKTFLAVGAAAMLVTTWGAIRHSVVGTVSPEPASEEPSSASSNGVELPSTVGNTLNTQPTLPAVVLTDNRQFEPAGVATIPPVAQPRSLRAPPTANSVAFSRAGGVAGSAAQVSRAGVVLTAAPVRPTATATFSPSSVPPADTEDPVGF